MIITPYSVFYSIIWGSVSLIFLRTSYLFLLRHNCFKLVLYCSVFVILRYLFVLDLPFRMIPDPIYSVSEKITYYGNKLIDCIPDILLYLFPMRYWIMIGQGLLFVWFAIAVFLIVKDLKALRYITDRSNVLSMDEECIRARKILKELQKEQGKNYDINIICSPYVQVPFARGWLHPVIYLGIADMGECELHDILKHEYTHILYHDNWLKIILHYAKLLLWWNPLISYLTNIIEDACEYRCDSVVTQHMDDMAKVNYASMINRYSAKEIFDIKLRGLDSAYVSSKEKDYIFRRVSAFLKPEPMKLSKKIMYLSVVVVISCGSIVFSMPTIEQSGNIILDIQFTEITGDSAYLVRKNDGSYSLYMYEVLINDNIKDISDFDLPIKEEKK